MCAECVPKQKFRVGFSTFLGARAPRRLRVQSSPRVDRPWTGSGVAAARRRRGAVSLSHPEAARQGSPPRPSRPSPGPPPARRCDPTETDCRVPRCPAATPPGNTHDHELPASRARREPRTGYGRTPTAPSLQPHPYLACTGSIPLFIARRGSASESRDLHLPGCGLHPFLSCGDGRFFLCCRSGLCCCW